MRWEYQLLAIIGFSIFFVIIGLMTSWINPLEINVFHMIGLAVIPGCFAVLMAWHLMKAASPPLLTYGKSYRFNYKEFETFQWKNDFIRDEAGQYLEVAALCLNGIDFKGFNPKSPPNEPILYCFSEDIEKIGDGYACYGLPRPTIKRKLPPYHRYWSDVYLKRRYNGCDDFIISYCSMIRGDANSKNEKVIFNLEGKFEYTTDLENIIKELRSQLKHAKSLREPNILNVTSPENP